MKNYILHYIKDNNYIIKKILFFLGIGVIFGILYFIFFSKDISYELLLNIKNNLDLAKQDNFNTINIIKNGMIINIILILIIYFNSYCLICEKLASLITFFKGTTIGMYIYITFCIFDLKNAIFNILSIVIIPNIIYIPTFIYLIANSINWHKNVIDLKKMNKINLLKEALYILVCLSLMFASVMLEQVMCNIIISMLKSI